MGLYGAIDLHSQNNVLVVMDEKDRTRVEKRLPNELQSVLKELKPYKKGLDGVVVESTYNWYWLVDGLMEAGYSVHLANTSAIQQYEGLKYTDDRHDARWLAHMMRLNILPEGHIYPKEERGVRDLLRKRGHLVRQRTSNVVSIKNLIARQKGKTLSAERIKKLSDEEVDRGFEDRDVGMAIKSSLAVIRCLEEEIRAIEKRVKAVARLRPEYKQLLTVPGIWETLAMTISLETGHISRFPRPGNYVSYCRGVGSKRLSNGKKKGTGNRKNGNAHLAWAFVEAAACAIIHDPQCRRYYQRKASRTNAIVARKALASKISRACYYIMRDQVPFEPKKMFGAE